MSYFKNFLPPEIITDPLHARRQMPNVRTTRA